MTYLLFDDGNGRQHYCCITNLAKLVGVQISRHGHTTLLCKRCFKSYFGVSRWDVSAEQRLKDHKMNCNKNKPIIPLLPNPNTFIKFENWGRSQNHPFAIYADFESILEKQTDTNITSNTNIIHHYNVMSYCYFVKPNDDTPIYLLEEFNIETDSVIFKGDSSFGRGDVAKKFIEEIVKVALKIENILNLNIPIIMSEENKIYHDDIIAKGTCPLCKVKFVQSLNNAVADHDHLTGK
jgi:hypothetical protein